MARAALKPAILEVKKTHVALAGVGAFMQMSQPTTATCRRLSATDAGLVFVKDGRKIIHQDGLELIVPPGSAVVLPTGSEFDITNEVGSSGFYEAMVVYFDPSILPTMPAPKTKPVETVISLGRVKPEFVAAMEAAVTVLEDPSLPSQIAAHRFGELLLWIQALGHSIVKPVTQNLLNEVRKLLSTDPSAKWTTTQIAKELAVSEATLRRKLAKAGTTLTDISIDVRMTCALGMLQSSEENITGIALAVGYDSPSRFALRFRDRFGVSPSDFRRS
jgi:AraC-like DNA-binding protein